MIIRHCQHIWKTIRLRTRIKAKHRPWVLKALYPGGLNGTCQGQQLAGTQLELFCFHWILVCLEGCPGWFNNSDLHQQPQATSAVLQDMHQHTLTSFLAFVVVHCVVIISFVSDPASTPMSHQISSLTRACYLRRDRRCWPSLPVNFLLQRSCLMRRHLQYWMMDARLEAGQRIEKNRAEGERGRTAGNASLSQIGRLESPPLSPCSVPYLSP